MNGHFNVPPQPPVQSGAVHLPVVYVSEASAWEYKQIIRNLAKEQAMTEDELNALGTDGWELAGVFTDSPFAYFYFKRIVA